MAIGIGVVPFTGATAITIVALSTGGIATTIGRSTGVIATTIGTGDLVGTVAGGDSSHLILTSPKLDRPGRAKALFAARTPLPERYEWPVG